MNAKITLLLVKRVQRSNVRCPLDHLVHPLDTAHHFVSKKKRESHDAIKTKSTVTIH